jgi:hypothetical protein
MVRKKPPRKYASPGSVRYRAYYAQQRRRDRKADRGT